MFRKIFWVGMYPPQAHNIGDHAQTLAVRKILNKNYPDNEIIKIDRSNMLELFRNNQINHKDLILIISSGDFGDYYPWFHQIRREIIRKFPKNHIVQLPVTIYYKNLREFELDKQVFGSHKKLLLMCRDKISYNLVKNDFSCKTMFFPGFVFNLKPKISKTKRKGVLAVIRKDSETYNNDKIYRFLSSNQKTKLLSKAYFHTLRRATLQHKINNIKKIIKSSNQSVVFQDVQTSNCDITDQNREQIVMNAIKFYSKFKVSVTDRFHGVLFSILAQTPCIAMNDNIPHKIRGYKDCLKGKIKFVQSTQQIPKEIEFEISRKKNQLVHEKSYFSEYFDNFKNIIENY